jgi:2-haloalkanoic acid dehalogenase type II
MAIKAVILDFGGTLSDGAFDWAPYHEKLRSILASRGYLVEMSRLKKALRGALGDLNRVRAKGKEMTFEEVYDIFLSRLEIPGDREILDELHDNFRYHHRTDFFPCVEDVLKGLTERYKVALLSNTMSDQPKILLAESGFDRYFDLIICSRDLGLRKPNPKIFKYVLERLEVKPDEAVHVGDSVEADMIGARDSDITGVWIKTPDQPLWSGYAISSICELPEFLENINR